VSANDQVQVRPLGTAAFSGDLESARVLLEAGADANGAGSGGFVPLHTAAQNGDADLVRLLLDHGARPDVATADVKTPEQLASDAGHEEVVALLRAAPAPARG
jgi:ankyrin repeat protein